MHLSFQFRIIISEKHKGKPLFIKPGKENMIRFILVCITVIGYLILSIPILLVEWIIGKISPMKKDISSLRIIQAVFRFILWLTGSKITVIGEENVPKDAPVLYIGNHCSYFDILLTYSRCPIRTGYIAKKEMEKIPLLSTWRGRVPVHRNF